MIYLLKYFSEAKLHRGMAQTTFERTSYRIYDSVSNFVWPMQFNLSRKFEITEWRCDPKEMSPIKIILVAFFRSALFHECASSIKETIVVSFVLYVNISIIRGLLTVGPTSGTLFNRKGTTAN